MPEYSIIESELQNIKRELLIVRIVAERKTTRNLDEIDIRAAALSLAAMYNGMEKILIQLLILKKIEINESSAWHSMLLQKAKDAGIISEIVFTDLKGFMGFRHFVRHAYSFDIAPETIEAVIDKAPKLVDCFYNEIVEYMARP